MQQVRVARESGKPTGIGKAPFRHHGFAASTQPGDQPARSKRPRIAGLFAVQFSPDETVLRLDFFLVRIHRNAGTHDVLVAVDVVDAGHR